MATTVDDARKLVSVAMMEDGCACPVCDQFVKAYRRSITVTMARWLIWLHGACESSDHPARWVDVRTSPVRGGDYAKLRYWGLAENMPNDRPETRNSGMWRTTARGARFVCRRAWAPRYLVIYNARVIEESAQTVCIVDSLREKYDYRDLMKRAGLSTDDATRGNADMLLPFNIH